MLESILLILGALLVTAIGVSGDTHYENKTGFFRRINPKGWLVMSANLIIFLVSLIQIKNTEDELNWQKIQRAKIELIAHKALEEVIQDRINLFQHLSDHIRIKYVYGYMRDTPFSGLEDLEDKYYINYFDSIKLSDSTSIGPFIITWEDLITQNTNTFHNRINEIWSKFSLYYETETVVILDSLLRHDACNFENLRVLRKIYREPYDLYVSHIILTHDSRKHKFINYLNMLKRIYFLCKEKSKQFE